MRTVLFFSAILALGLAFTFRPRIAGTVVRVSLLGLAALVALTPFAWLVAAAFKDGTVLNEYVFLPPIESWSKGTLNLNNFRELLRGHDSLDGTIHFWQYVLNSVFLTTASTSIQLVLCSMGGYALAKYQFQGKRIIMLFMLGSMMIPGLLLLAPLYKMSVNLSLVDTYWSLLLPGSVGAYGIFLFRQAIVAVPNEMLEAARIDGCSELGIYARIVMPVVRPMTAAFCLISILGNWNSYLGPNIFLQSQDKLTLPVVLSLYVGQYTNQYGVFLAGTLLAIVPPALVFVALQKEFIGGLTAGAVKG